MSSSKARFFNPAVVGLIMLSFFLGTSEYTVIGILPEIADGFGISLTQAGLDYAGVSKATGDARNAGYYMLEGQKINDVQKFYQMVGDRGNGTTEFYRYDGTNIRLREVSLGYSFPQQMLEKTGFIKGIDLSLVARNLFFIYKDAPFDPDATMSVGNDNQGLDTFGMPSTRNIGFNIKFTF